MEPLKAYLKRKYKEGDWIGRVKKVTLSMERIGEMAYEDIKTAWRQKNLKSKEDYLTALDNFRIIFAYNSGVIENPEITYHNTREIFENGKVVNFTGDLRTLYEIENQKKCFDYLIDKIVDKEPVTPELIRRIHKKLTVGTYDEVRWNKGERPGEYKKHDYVVADGQGDLPEEVPGDISDLCNEIADIPDKGENILKTAAYLHCRFENIHPFADGNGRVGRTLMNYYLMIHNHPPIVVSNETKDLYYGALMIYDKTGEISGFCNYMKGAAEETWKIKKAPVKSLLQELCEEP